MRRQVRSMTKVSLVRAIQQLQKQSILPILEARPELLWHNCCLVQKGNNGLVKLLLVKREKKKKKKKGLLLIAWDYCIIFRASFLQVWKYKLWAVLQTLHIQCKYFIICGFVADFLSSFSFFFSSLNPFNHLLDLQFSSVHFFFATLSPAFHR